MPDGGMPDGLPTCMGPVDAPLPDGVRIWIVPTEMVMVDEYANDLSDGAFWCNCLRKLASAAEMSLLWLGFAHCVEIGWG
jgi:hypothetical protein